MHPEEKAAESLQTNVVFNINEILAIWSSEGSFYLCICVENVMKSSKTLKIRWLSELTDKDTYKISYRDKVDIDSVLTTVDVRKIGINYKLTKKERKRVLNLLTEAEYKEATQFPTTSTPNSSNANSFTKSKVTTPTSSASVNTPMSSTVNTTDLTKEQATKELSTTSTAKVQEKVFQKRSFQRKSNKKRARQELTNDSNEEQLQREPARKRSRQEVSKELVTNPTDSTSNIPVYDSSIDEFTEQARQPKSKKIWIESRIFVTAVQAKAFIKNEYTWSINTTNKLSTGKKVIYRCSNAKLRGKQCDASISLFYPSQKLEVLLYTTANEHTCQPNQNKRMTQKTKEIIRKHFIDGIKTRKRINAKLAADNVALPSKHQMNNFISQLNLELYGPGTISLGELEVFLRDHSTIPQDPNEAFIVDYECNDRKEGDFKFFVSTMTLLQNAIDIDIVSAVSTYKMVWQGFPISPVGTIDKDRHFHLFGTLISKEEKSADYTFAFKAVKDAVRKLFNHELNPKILISDAAGAIHKGANAVFGMEIVILMCYFHLKKAVRKNIDQFVKNSETQSQILSDISALNLSQTKDIFDKASKLFLKKYSAYKDFCVYFKGEWLIKNRNWYEGATLLAGVKTAPSTNNAIESWNRYIKDEKTERNRYPLNIFKKKILEWTVEWSREYTSGAKTYIRIPTIDLPLWTLAYKWVKSNKPIKQCVDENGLRYHKFAAGEAVTLNDCDILKNWNTFEQFKERTALGWTTNIQGPHNWISGHCNCPSFMKMFICKHIVGLAVRLKYVKAPIEAKALPLNQKRKRGRPTKARKALLVQ